MESEKHELNSEGNATNIKLLETEDEYKQRWNSIRTMYFTMFLMALGFSVVLTGVWPYLDELDPTAGKEFMGYVVAANPLAQMIFSPLVGWWGNRRGSVRLPLVISLLIFTFANAAYSMLEVVPSYRKYWMLLSRFFIGVSSANIAICRSYLSAATKLNERTQAVSMVSLAQVLGFIVGPGLQAAVTPLGEQGKVLFKGWITLNMYTAAGWINVLLGLFNAILFSPFYFTERYIAAREAMIMVGAKSEKAAWKGCKPDYLCAWTMIIAFFILVFNFVLLETLGTSLTMDQFAWTKSQALSNIGILLSAGGVIACVAFVLIKPLCKHFNECRVLVWGGFFLMVLGRAVYIPYGNDPPIIAYPTMNDTEPVGCPVKQDWCSYTPKMTLEQFLLGFILTTIGYPVGITLIQTIFSKILGPRPQGVWMGLMTGSGCLSRVLGPVFVSYVYTRYGTVWTFVLTTATMLAALLWLQWLSGRINHAVTHMVNGAQPRAPDIDCEMLDTISEVPLNVISR
ncbi:major facilitator superfamily domain-containing protein 8-like [Macrosteles quadrilineatus]|uniref:major facilitator superfamily domain-containing protein 8-like n=1 Tax=Macrosteles quadrilineatus TaxID=74068 RepID=UPI0023E145CF|nr:major facilitator superfamily domain-containing protein 8-like [Macrosteles quadrilineatus]